MPRISDFFLRNGALVVCSAALFLSGCTRIYSPSEEYAGDDDQVIELLERERDLIPSGVVNTLKGTDLREHHFVWVLTSLLHPSGGELGEWWEYRGIDEVLAVVRTAYPDPFTLYLPPAYADLFLEDWDETLDTTVFVEWVTDRTPLIRITEFRENSIGRKRGGDTSGTWSEFLDALEATEEASAAILDLRGNPGGAIEICTGIADELVDGGVLYLELDYWSNIDTTVALVNRIESAPGGAGIGREWVVLQDSGSASCSELLLVALKGNGVGKSIGTPSYGKGIGQSYIPTPLNGILGVTSFEFFGNDSLNYHAVGLLPDSAVSVPEEQLAAALRWAEPELAPPPGAAGVSPLRSSERGGVGVAAAQRRAEQQRVPADGYPLYRFRPSPLF